jgi:hypothetical protein
MTAAEEIKSEYLSEQEEFMHKSVEALRNDRYKGLPHPPHVKLGRVVVYPKKDLQEWLAARTVKTTH